jgi:hypothetical protein
MSIGAGGSPTELAGSSISSNARPGLMTTTMSARRCASSPAASHSACSAARVPS